MTRSIQVDTWMKYLEQRMRYAVKDQLFHAFEGLWKQDLDEWLVSWCGQSLFVASQVWYSASVKATHLSAEAMLYEARRLERDVDSNADAVSQRSKASQASKAVTSNAAEEES